MYLSLSYPLVTKSVRFHYARHNNTMNKNHSCHLEVSLHPLLDLLPLRFHFFSVSVVVTTDPHPISLLLPRLAGQRLKPDRTSNLTSAILRSLITGSLLWITVTRPSPTIGSRRRWTTDSRRACWTSGSILRLRSFLWGFPPTSGHR